MRWLRRIVILLAASAAASSSAAHAQGAPAADAGLERMVSLGRLWATVKYFHPHLAYTGLFFKAANGTVFVGTPTSGADGDVVSFTVPGGITLTYSGQGVTWPDGRQLQRAGLEPDVVAQPTVAGIRAGRDEVLDRAVAWVHANVPAPIARSR